MLFLGRKVLLPLFDKISQSQELLFLTSLAWCFGTAVLVSKTGFSIEIGGFLAGLALANSSEHFQISAKIKSLRDFFILIFFVILGSSLIGASFSGIIWPMIILSLFVLVGNPLIVMAIMGIMGYRKRTGFMCGVTVAQISEFSLILAALGLKLGHLNNSVVSLITGVGIITITVSSYMVLYSEKIFVKISKHLSIFEKKRNKEKTAYDFEFRKPIVMIGAHRVGKNIASHLSKDDLLIIDFDPDIMGEMKRKGYAVLFGDIADEEIADKSNFDSAKLVICTSPDFEDNMRILSRIKSIKKNKPKIIVRAEDENNARDFYKEGADYVIIPHLTSGQYIGKLIAGDGDFKALEQLKKKDLKLI
jgi:voltage-gated potassium channel Kch